MEDSGNLAKLKRSPCDETVVNGASYNAHIAIQEGLQTQSGQAFRQEALIEQINVRRHGPRCDTAHVRWH